MTALHRTAVYVEGIEGDYVRCTPGGVDGARGNALVALSDFPEPLRDGIEAGKVFFAHVDLHARPPAYVRVERIEDEWGETSQSNAERIAVLRAARDGKANYVTSLLMTEMGHANLWEIEVIGEKPREQPYVAHGNFLVTTDPVWRSKLTEAGTRLLAELETEEADA